MEGRIKEVILRYADIRADGIKDFLKLTEASEYFVPADFEETEDGLRFKFRTDGLISFSELAKEENLRKHAVLLTTLELGDITDDFEFSMNPENLFYSLTGEVKILVRDIADKEAQNKKDFLKKYKALVGAVLHRKYSYEDFIEGGESLLKKKRFTEKIYDGTEDEIREILRERIENEHEKLLHEKTIVHKKSLSLLKVIVAVLGILTAAGLVFVGYYFEIIYPYQNAVQNAMNAHIDHNLVELIDSMEAVKLSQMDHYQKYILAEAYINGENLSLEQKTTILSTLTVNQNEKIFDYWIYVGRQNPVEAENIAMQLSDDELLLYAYLLDKDMIQADTEMDGEEKKTRLSELDSKIKEYTKELTEEKQEEEKEETE